MPACQILFLHSWPFDDMDVPQDGALTKMSAIFKFRVAALPRDTWVSWRKRVSAACALLTVLAFPALSYADGLSAVKSCEADNSPPEDTARLTILPNGETRGSDTAATLIRIARQKAKEGKDAEAIQWAALCQFEAREQEAIRRDSATVLQYLKQ
jgi:hypothetical protein